MELTCGRPQFMTTLKITSLEALDSAVADAVRLKIEHTKLTATKEEETTAIEKRHQKLISACADKISAVETAVHEYCRAHRGDLFTDKKSRETTLAIFGFELTPHRVETNSRKIKWADVVARLMRLPWGKAYVAWSTPKPDKNALLADREKLTAEQLMAAGIEFAQDEQFFIRPKPETAEETTR